MRLTDTQVQIANHLASHGEALVWAGMGTGKTLATLRALEFHLAMGTIRRPLIVAPKRVAILTWPDEAEQWSDLRVGVFRGTMPDDPIIATNYEQLPKLAKMVKPGFFDAIVWDEVTKLKNPTSKRFRAFRRHAAAAKIRWGLTGTPMPNGHLDLWGQVRAIDGGKRFGPFWQWRNRYFESDYMGYNWAPRPGSVAAMQEILADIVLSCESPGWPIYEDDIEVALPEDIRQDVYRPMEREFLARLRDGTVTAANAAVAVGKLLQITAGFVYHEDGEPERVHGAKVGAIRREIAETDGPVLVAVAYRAERDRLVDELDAHALTTDDVAAWNRREIPVAVAHPASFGHGLNMQRGGSRVIWASPTWSRELYEQFNARLARRGQEGTVRVSRVVCPDTIDEVVYAALEGKGRSQERMARALRAYAAGR